MVINYKELQGPKDTLSMGTGHALETHEVIFEGVMYTEKC